MRCSCCGGVSVRRPGMLYNPRTWLCRSCRVALADGPLTVTRPRAEDPRTGRRVWRALSAAGNTMAVVGTLRGPPPVPV
jgi:hypothetical protein